MEKQTTDNMLKAILDKGIKIYPVSNVKHRFAVNVHDPEQNVFKKEFTIGDYKHTSKTLNEAIQETLEHVYRLLSKKGN